MKADSECILCFYQQALRLLNIVRASEKDKHRILAQVGRYLGRQYVLKSTPCHYTSRIYRLIYTALKIRDPYRDLKNEYNRRIIKALPFLRRAVQKSPHPLKQALRFSALGNVIDFGVFHPFNIRREMRNHGSIRMARDDYFLFKKDLASARNILFLADNAGEIVFDLLLLKQIFRMRPVSLTLAVKGGPIINDVTCEDLRSVPLPRYVRVLSNGSSHVGTILDSCSAAFRKEFATADLVLAKGQANFETLDRTVHKALYFLFKVKCDIVSRYLKVRKGDFVFLKSGKGGRWKS